MFGLISGAVIDSVGVVKEQTPGRYEVMFNASGTYNYRISAGDFVDTKKLMLLK